MNPSSTTYLSVLAWFSLNPSIFSLAARNPLYHSCFLAAKSLNSSFCLSMAACFQQKSALIRMSSIFQYFLRISFYCQNRALSSYSGRRLSSLGRHWTSWILFWRVSLVTIQPIKFQTWYPRSVPSRMNLPEGSTSKKVMPLTMRLCLENSKLSPFFLSLFSLEMIPKLNLPFSALSSVMLYRAKKAPLLVSTTRFWRLLGIYPILCTSKVLFLVDSSQKLTMNLRLMLLLIDSSLQITAMRLLMLSKLMFPTSSLNSMLLMDRFYSLFSKLQICTAVVKWPFFMNFLRAMATHSPFSLTKTSPFLACSLQALHFLSLLLSTLQRKILVAEALMGLQSLSQHITRSSSFCLSQAIFWMQGVLMICCSSSGAFICLRSSSTEDVWKRKTSCWRATERLRPSCENQKHSRFWLLWARQALSLTYYSTAQIMKFSLFLLVGPLELTRKHSSGENLASMGLAWRSKPLCLRELLQQSCTPSWQQTARQDPLGENTALLTWKPSCWQLPSRADFALLSRWSNHWRQRVLSSLTRNWFLNCSSMLCSLKLLEEGFCGSVNSVGTGWSSSSMSALISLTQTQLMGWVGSNLRLLSLLYAVLACGMVWQVRYRVPLLLAPSIPTVSSTSPFFYPMFLPASSFSLNNLTNFSCCSSLMVGNPLTELQFHVPMN